MSGPLSPDGRHQWNGDAWVPVSKPPMSLHQWFQIGLVVFLVVVVLAALVTL